MTLRTSTRNFFRLIFVATLAFGLDCGLVTVSRAADPPDLSLTMLRTGNLVFGRTGNYSLIVRNQGGVTGNPTGVTDQLPPGLTYLGSAPSDWICSASGQNLTCTRTSTLEGGASSRIEVAVTVTAVAGTVITNRATVQVSGDANPGNDTASDTTTVIAQPANPGPAHLVKDIETTLRAREIPILSTSSAVSGGITYFALSDELRGSELWRTDGTPGGTYLLKDIFPGNQSSNPRKFCELGGTVYFAADDGAHGVELWRTDGTEAGTMLLCDLAPGPSPSEIYELTPYNSYLFCVANLPGSGFGLWRSDGTSAGTSLFLSVRAMEMTVANGLLFFSGGSPANGNELWVSDGSVAGTRVVKDIREGPASSSPGSLVSAGSILFFFANDGVHGRELWRSDGTEAGTALARDLVEGAGSTSTPEMGVLPGLLVFTHPSSGEVWRSDGTEAGTVLVKDIYPGSERSEARLFQASGAHLFFVATDGVHGFELWRTDGTEPGTVLVRDVWAGPDSALPDWTPVPLIAVGEQVFLSAYGPEGRELWVSDGSEAGTRLVQDIWPGPASSFPEAFLRLDGGVLFKANNGSDGVELWTSDGVIATALTSFESLSSLIKKGVEINGVYYFVATTMEHGEEVWRSDGTEAGTWIVKDIDPWSWASPRNLTVLNDTLYFFARNSSGAHLWRSDGTTGGTSPIATSEVGYLGDELVVANDRLFFALADSEHGAELWCSDGTPGGTFLVKDIFDGNGWGNAFRLSAAGDRVFFLALDGSYYRVWTSDGTEAGTYSLITAWMTPVGAVGSVFYFFSDGNGALWRSGGTIASTSIVKDINPGPAPSECSNGGVTINGVLYFSATDGVHGCELWRTDGTEAGTRMVRDSYPGAAGSYPDHMTRSGDVVYFSADDGVHGVELWRSDGTEEGTRITVDAVPGAGSSSPHDLTPLGRGLLFAANDPAHGTELWKSDGTEAGTVLVQDINPGPASSAIGQMVVAGSRVLFSANDGISGSELWALETCDVMPCVEVFFTGPDNGLYQLRTDRDAIGADVSVLPGGGSSSHAAAIATHRDRQYIAVKGANGSSISIKSRARDGSFSDSGWALVPGGTSSSPALCVFNDRLYLFLKGGSSNSLFYRSMDGTGTWTGWSQLSGSNTLWRPALVVFGGRLYCFETDATSNRLWYRAMNDAGSWGDWLMIPTGSTNAGPAAAVHDGTIWLFVKGLAGKMLWWCSTSTPEATSSWTAWTSCNGSSEAAPGVALDPLENVFHLVVRGNMVPRLWHRTLDPASLAWSDWHLLTNLDPAAQSIDSPTVVPANW